MKRVSRRRKQTITAAMTELMIASYETIARRGLAMALGTCSRAEYRRMIMEKLAASKQSALALMSGRGTRLALAPWHKRATANAKRLRRRR
jgi:hypothetical protein